MGTALSTAEGGRFNGLVKAVERSYRSLLGNWLLALDDRLTGESLSAEGRVTGSERVNHWQLKGESLAIKGQLFPAVVSGRFIGLVEGVMSGDGRMLVPGLGALSTDSYEVTELYFENLTRLEPITLCHDCLLSQT